MYLEAINNPTDVKKLTLEQLPALAEEMRHALCFAQVNTADILGQISVS